MGTIKDAEVDFVLEKFDKVIGLEVKSGMKAENTQYYRFGYFTSGN